MTDAVTRVIGEDDAGRRLDVVVGEMDPVETRAEAQRLLEAGLVLVNGEPVRKRYIMRLGDILEVVPTPREPSSLEPEDVPFDVRYEDEFVIVVDKPAGVVTHPSRGHESGTLVHGLLARGIAGGDSARPGIVHRLDRDTSGLLVVAKEERTHRRLQASLRDRHIERRYTVLVHGETTVAFAVNRPIGRDRRRRTRMSVDTDRPREARTSFRRLELFAAHSLLEAKLDTGRTHQIRVHLESIRHPVVGDPVYGRSGGNEGLTRQFLHAAVLSFPHPHSDETITIESPLPADLQAVLDRLRDAAATAR